MRVIRFDVDGVQFQSAIILIDEDAEKLCASLNSGVGDIAAHILDAQEAFSERLQDPAEVESVSVGVEGMTFLDADRKGLLLVECPAGTRTSYRHEVEEQIQRAMSHCASRVLVLPSGFRVRP